MKRIFIIILCCILLLAGCGRIEQRTLNRTQGRLLFCNNDSLMFICDGSAIVINTDGLENADSFNDGDLVEVWHDDVLTSYPGQTKAYKIELIEKGSVFDIDESIIQSLYDMGWIDKVVINDSETTENYTLCEYSYCRMGVELPETWHAEVNKSDTECSIKFRPVDENTGWIVLQCTSYPFVVCGTGLQLKKENIGGYEATVTYYEDNEQFSFIRFEMPGEYIIRNVGNSTWFCKHREEINGILKTLILSDPTLTYDDIYSKVNRSVSEYESINAFYNCFGGMWTVDVYIDSKRYQIKYDNEGNEIEGLTSVQN